MTATALRERDAALRAVEGCLDEARAGRGGCLFVIGEAGLGKTTVLEQALSSARDGFEVQLARGEVIESGLAFGLARDLLGELSGLDAEPVGDSSTPIYRALRSLRARPGSPLLLAVDDLQWADPDSLRLLLFLAARLRELPVALIATLRPWPTAAVDACAGLQADGRCVLQRLLPLSRGAAAGLLADRAGTLVAQGAERRVWELCAGNPLLVVQVAMALGHGERVPEAGEPETLRTSLLLSRFAGVGERGLALARAGSVLGSAFRVGLAAEMSGVAEGEIDDALEALSRSGLLADGARGEARFVHPLFAEALYDDIPPAVRRRLHERAFRLLAAAGLEAEAAAHAVAAELVGDAQARELLARVGRWALEAGAVESAGRLLEAAVRLAGDRAGAQVRCALAEALIKAGRVSDALGVLGPLLAVRAPDWGERYAALRVHARALSMAGSFQLSEQEHEEAVTLALEHGCPELALEPLLDQTLTEWHLAGPGVAVERAARARAIAHGAEGHLSDRAQAVWAKIAFQTGDPSGLAAALEIAARVQGDGHGGGVGREELVFPGNTLDQLAELAIMAERFEEADRACAAVQRVAEPAGAFNALSTALCLRSEALTRRGRLAEALAVIGRWEPLAELFATVREYLELFRAETLLWLGRLQDSEASCQIAERGLPGLWYPRLRIAHLRGLRLLWQGDSRASDMFLEAEELTRRAGIGEPCVVCWAGHAIDAHVQFGRSEDAVRVLAWLTECAEGLPCRWPRAQADLGRAAIAAQDGDEATAIDCYEAALSKLEQTDRPLERVEALLAYGRFLRRRGRPRDARAPLAQAYELAEAREAAWLAATARRELGLAGGRRRRRTEDRDQLTDAERRVAELAADGLTNAQIAGRLYLSLSTIETHLRHIYQKLGIRSRRELQALAPAFEPRQTS
jgi:DNA-binding CsgD family transcriptional regulator